MHAASATILDKSTLNKTKKYYFKSEKYPTN